MRNSFSAVWRRRLIPAKLIHSPGQIKNAIAKRRIARVNHAAIVSLLPWDVGGQESTGKVPQGNNPLISQEQAIRPGTDSITGKVRLWITERPPTAARSPRVPK